MAAARVDAGRRKLAGLVSGRPQDRVFQVREGRAPDRRVRQARQRRRRGGGAVSLRRLGGADGLVSGREGLAPRLPQARGRTEVGDLVSSPSPATASPRRFSRDRNRSRAATFSPDGRWITYLSEESGRAELYATAFPGPGGKMAGLLGRRGRRLLARGRRQDSLRPGGVELRCGRQESASGLEIGSPRKLADLPDFETIGGTHDGKRVLLAQHPDAAEAARVAFVANWPAALAGK